MPRKKVPRVEYAPQPADDPEVPYRRIYRPKVGSKVEGIIVSEEVIGVWVHWMGRHDEPHIEPKEECPGCKVGTRSLRWKGYLEVLWPVNGTCFLAEISEGALRSCKELSEKGTVLRGRTIVLRRAGETAQSRIIAEVSAIRADAKLPRPSNVKKCLEAIWFGRTRLLPFAEQEGEKDNEGTI